LDLLAPKPGEHILDLGCGTGHLTAKIAESGADVVGLDASPEMIGQARQNFPALRFILGSGTSLQFNAEFDAVFSNAALHWMLEIDSVAQGIARALRTGGRLVAELGGKGNIGAIMAALEMVLPRYYGEAMPKSRNYFPSIAEFGTVLERHGLEVRTAELFDRPTPLTGPDGMEEWLRQFKWYYFEGLPREQRNKALADVVLELAPKLRSGGQWIADYRRLRIVAVKC
jgi:trans-aconitate methyltransferase